MKLSGTAASVARVGQEVKALRFDEGLPFASLLDAQQILEVLQELGVKYRERIFTPIVTLWTFLSQVISTKTGSCREAVSRVNAYRAATGQKVCSPDSSSYCAARMRLPLELVRKLATRLGQRLHGASLEHWKFEGRPVVIVDGSTVAMPDTPENQKQFPQPRTQKPGLGFPMLRFVVLLSHSTGALLHAAVGPVMGKKTGELSLFRQIMRHLKPGTILLGDALYDSFREMAVLRARGVDVVFGMKPSRKNKLPAGAAIRIKSEQIVTLPRPKYDAARFESRAFWAALPESITAREVLLVVERKGFRSRTIRVITSLVDREAYPLEDIAALFAERWYCELDLRSIKQHLGMDELACKTPAMAVKELWTYFLAYNLIRLRIAQAAARHGVKPMHISFTAAMGHVANFSPYMMRATGAEYTRLEDCMLSLIARSTLPRRPGRVEPRRKKRRDAKYPALTKPRDEARKALVA